MTVDVERNHTLRLVRNQLPGEPVPYAVAHGEGDRYVLDDQLWTLFARSADTGGLFEAAWIDGGSGASTASHAHAAQHRSFLVVKGTVDIVLDGRRTVVSAGDSFHVPPGVTLSYRMLARANRLLAWSAPAGGLAYVEAIGERVDRHIQPARAGTAPGGLRRTEAAEAAGISFTDVRETADAFPDSDAVPATVVPYVLRAGDGDRLHIGDALYTYLTRGTTTGKRSFAIHTYGGPSRYFGQHFHQQHTENFLCLTGRVWVYANGEELLLTAGDFVHAPAGTIHTFAFDAHRTEMLGILSPDVFEPFFQVLGTPTSDFVYDELLAETGPPPVGALQRLQEELDLVIVGPPPQRTAGLDL